MTLRRALALSCLALTALSAAEQGAARIKKDVYWLASDKRKGRGAGTPELEQSAEYIAKRMWHIGLQPGTAGGWFQNVPVHASTAGTIDVSLEGGGSSFKLTPDNARAMSARSSSFSGAAVIKVDRDSARKLKAEDVKGKIVLTTSFGGSVRVGPPALVILASGEGARMMNMLPSVMPVLQTDSRRGGGAPVLLISDEVLAKWITSLPVGPVAEAKATGRVEAVERDFNLRNVLGVLPGSDPTLRDSCVIVSAHYDHLGEAPGGTDRIRNGATDDASGVGSMLAVAKLLMAGKTKPKRTIVFAAWTGEESGGLGSQFYAANPVFPNRKTVAMVNLEQTGRYDGEGGAGKNRAFVTGYSYTDVGKILTDAAKPTGVEIYAGPDEFFGRSDNLFLARAGVPAHTVGSALEFPDYHQPTDSAEKLDYDNMAVMAKGIAAGVLAIANSDSEPKWNESIPATAEYRKAR